MENRTTIVDLNDIALFVQVVRHGSLSEAGRRLNLPVNTVSRRMQQLEAKLGLRLMQRSTRKLTLTEEGQAFHDRCAAAIDGLNEASVDFSLGSKVPRGSIRVAVPLSFFSLVPMTTVKEFLTAFPLVRLEFVMDDALTDMVAERIDVAFRSHALLAPHHIARRLASMVLGLYASAGYLEARGVPATLQDLAHHDCLGLAPGAASRLVWRLQAPDGAEETIEVSGRIAANSYLALLDAAAEGLGIIMAPSHMVRGLVPVLPAYKLHDQGLSAVYPSRRQRSPAVSALVDLVADKMRATAHLDSAVG